MTNENQQLNPMEALEVINLEVKKDFVDVLPLDECLEMCEQVVLLYKITDKDVLISELGKIIIKQINVCIDIDKNFTFQNVQPIDDFKDMFLRNNQHFLYMGEENKFKLMCGQIIHIASQGTTYFMDFSFSLRSMAGYLHAIEEIGEIKGFTLAEVLNPLMPVQSVANDSEETGEENE